MRKKVGTYYADFMNLNGKRIRKSLGKDKAQAKIKLMQLMADVEIQSIPPIGESIQAKFKGILIYIYMNIISRYKFIVR